MADEREKDEFDSESKSDQQTTGQQSQQAEQMTTGSEPLRSTEKKGGEFGQQDLRSDQQRGGAGGSESSGEGFVGSQGSGSDEYLQERGSSEKATGGSDFAKEGRGASEDDEGSTAGSNDEA
ncbi:MAG TPA: hypothetical protein VF067_04145 [Sphingomicrobium sp.]